MADKNVVGGGVPDTPEKKRRQEKETVGLMIELYCRGNHGTPKGQLCPDCAALRDYADARVDHCPHMATKTFCSVCKTHCYKPEMREHNTSRKGCVAPLGDFARLCCAHLHTDFLC